jgi:DNA-binding NarL/FixJ family response regulator
MKYLIVDDHGPTRRTVRELIAAADDDVREASDGAQAALAYEEQRPDWVIMDVQMAPVGGIAATRDITARHPGARIVIFTQHDDPDLRAVASEAGAHAFMTKDDFAGLRRIVQSAS